MTFDLAKAIAAATPVLTVRMPAGDYPFLPLSRVAPAAPVRIVADGAVRLAGLALNSCSNLIFEGFTFAPDPTATPTDATDTVKVQSSSNITFKGGRISAVKASTVGIPADSDPGKVARPHNWVLGQPIGRCINLLNSDHVTLDGVEICDGYKGLVLANVTDGSFVGLNVHGIRTALIAGGGVSRLAFADCHLHDAVAWRGTAVKASDGDHCDYLHLWISDNQTAPADEIKILRCLIEQGASSPEIGVALEDRSPAGLGYTNTDIVGCTFALNNNQAVSTSNHKSGHVDGNRFLPVAPLDGLSHAPGYIARSVGPAVTFDGNTVKPNSYTAGHPNNTFLTPAKIAQMGAMQPPA